MANALSTVCRCLMALTVLLTLPAQATTVHDPVNFVVNVLNKMENHVSAMQTKVMNHQLAVQIKNQLDTIHQLQKEYQKMQDMVDTLQGRSSYGKYLEGPFVMLDPDQSPESFDEVMYNMRDVGKGGDTQSDFQKEAAAFQRANPYVDLGNWQPAAEQGGITRREMDHQRETSMALGAASRQAYQQSSNHYKNMQMLRREMDKTDTVKESVDLTNRLLLEIVAVQAEQLRITSLQTGSQAQQQQQDYNEKARALKGKETAQPTLWKVE